MHFTKRRVIISMMLLFVYLIGACSDITNSPSNNRTLSSDDSKAKKSDVMDRRADSYVFNAPVFSIDATVNGGIILAETVFPGTEVPPEGTSTSMVKEIRANGKVRTVTELTTVSNSPINGLESIGNGNFFATGGGLDKAVGAKVFHASNGSQRLIGDIEKYEKDNDPDANSGAAWKLPACEENPAAGFTAGPQSNPYGVVKINGNEALVADAAGNSLYWTKANGDLELVATFTPPTESGVGSDNSEDWMVLFPLGEEANCYVQPVPTSVAVGPNGDYYVGELTGVTPANIGTGSSPKTGLSRIWRIDAGARDAVCPSDQCEVVASGLTSVLDLEFGADGWLYLVEYDKGGWYPATLPAPDTEIAGGTIKKCDVFGSGNCEVVFGSEEVVVYPSSITFDKWNNLWLLKENLFNPTVMKVNMD
ncbi:MAG: ScyD/ScyE family protein [Balneolaceae bacterium]|nr:ScyD/ScyE family protein [Balneolaceae bacterium]